MKAGNDLLIVAGSPINHRPHKSRVVTADYVKVFAKRFETVTTPDLALGFRVQDWFEIFVENVFVENNLITRHAYSPQTFQLALNCSGAKPCGWGAHSHN